jgi:hypothetical protein
VSRNGTSTGAWSAQSAWVRMKTQRRQRVATGGVNLVSLGPAGSNARHGRLMLTRHQLRGASRLSGAGSPCG